MTVVIVRHGSAGDRERWPGPDGERPLDERGRRQALGLIEVLDGVKIGRILSSPAIRCIQTVQPLADARSLAVEPSPALLEGAGDEAVALLRSATGEDAVLCTHGDIVPLLLDYLSRVDGVALEPKPRWPKGSSWVVDSDGGRFSAARYLPPAG
ncbi:MAG TPA: phosphoglycerate mutase family protein [Acidimicrobiales bacterium]|nr:phosphoglycerate mutase family protein [Acidimicrobiales bacterium]